MIKHARNLDMIKRHHKWPWVVLLVVVLLMALAGLSAYSFYSQAMQVKDHEEKALQLMDGLSGDDPMGSLQNISKKLPDIQQETSAANDISHGFLWNIAAHAPKVGGDITTVRGMTETVDSMMNETVPDFVTIITDLKDAQLSEGNGQLNLEPIVTAEKAMTKTNTSFQKQVKDFNGLPTPQISIIGNAYTKAQDKLNPIATQIDELSSMMHSIPVFLGSDQPRTYLLAAMTTSEARSAGGLIGSIGTVSADNGKITVGDFKSNSEYLNHGAGDPTEDEHRIFNEWGPVEMSFDIRDMAVYPETQRSAEGIRAIWQRTEWGANTPVDAVILIDPVFLQELNKINGEVDLPDGRVLNGDNTAEFLLNGVYKDYPVEVQDQYFQLVAAQSMGKMFSGMKLDKLMEVAKVMTSMTSGRHFSMYSFDDNLEKPIDEAGFTSHTPNSEENPSAGLYFTEQSASKIDWYVKRTSTITRLSCNPDGTQGYHVEYQIANTLTYTDLYALPKYITGMNNSDLPSGYAVEKALIYGPAGGAITNLSVTTGTNTPLVRDEAMNGTPIQAALMYIAPGDTATISFDVTTSPKAMTDLTLDQTPMGWVDQGVTTDNNACVIEK